MSIEHCSINLLEYDLYCKTFWRSGMGNRLWGEQQKLGMNLNPWISRGLVKNRTFFLEKGKVFFLKFISGGQKSGSKWSATSAPCPYIFPLRQPAGNSLRLTCSIWGSLPPSSSSAPFSSHQHLQHQLLLQLHQAPLQQGDVCPTKVVLPLTLSALSGDTARMPLTSHLQQLPLL